MRDMFFYSNIMDVGEIGRIDAFLLTFHKVLLFVSNSQKTEISTK